MHVQALINRRILPKLVVALVVAISCDLVFARVFAVILRNECE